MDTVEFSISEDVALPSKDEAQQGANENDDLVEHGRVCPLDCSVNIILHHNEKHYMNNLFHTPPAQKY